MRGLTTFLIKTVFCIHLRFFIPLLLLLLINHLFLTLLSIPSRHTHLEFWFFFVIDILSSKSCNLRLLNSYSVSDSDCLNGLNCISSFLSFLILSYIWVFSFSSNPGKEFPWALLLFWYTLLLVSHILFLFCCCLVIILHILVFLLSESGIPYESSGNSKPLLRCDYHFDSKLKLRDGMFYIEVGWWRGCPAL